MHTYIDPHKHTHTHIYMYMYMNICIHTYAYTHTHMSNTRMGSDIIDIYACDRQRIGSISFG